jgi:hypothetical protein
MEENKMNNWVIIGIIVGILIVGGVAFVSAISVNPANEKTTTSCTGCSENSCTSEKNCGLATCGAINSGKCNCGK